MLNFIDSSALMTFVINSKTGEATGEFYIKKITSASQTITNITTFTKEEENVGDMIISDYLIIEGRNYLNSNGEITLNECKKIFSNESLENVLILFENMYL